jgi:hypothetical protein
MDSDWHHSRFFGIAAAALLASSMQARAQPAIAEQPKPAQISPGSRPQLPPGQVFECLAGGQRIFSDAPCGPHASVRQLNELNIMDRSAVLPAPAYRSYGYRSAPEQAPPNEETPASDIASDPAIPEFIAVRERARRDHFPHHDNRPRPRPRKN